MPMRSVCVSAVVICLLLPPCVSTAQDWIQLRGVIHVQTRFDGSGRYTIDQLVSMAGQLGLEVLIPTDHDLQVMEYGVFPLRNLIKKREERDSVIKLGPEEYLDGINRVNRRQSEVLVIPGVQSSPFYYWTGSPFKKNLTAHNYRKELLLIGMQDPEDYRNLPLMHRGFSTRYTRELMPKSAVFLVTLFLALYLVSHGGFWRFVGMAIGIFSLLLLINHHPFQSSRFDPYHGDQGIKPFQELIDYVNKRNGMVFWSHPESNFATTGVPIGPVKFITPHYADALIESTGYTGFEAIYGDTITATDPGKHWDRVLTAYCQGRRARPVWGIAGVDFHVGRAKGGAVNLDDFQTVFLVRRKGVDEVLEALRAGRIYAVRKGRQAALTLDRFQIRDDSAGKVAGMGGMLHPKGDPVVAGELSATDRRSHPVTVTLIRGGRVIQTFNGNTPFSFRYRDRFTSPAKTFYRIAVQGKGVGQLLSNPVFVSTRSVF